MTRPDDPKPEEPAALRYGFGANWQRYLARCFSPERLEIARDHMLRFLRRRDLAGLSMIDIGCGSGLHSAAARMAGAGPLLSFDYDQDSVAATGRVRDAVTDGGADADGWDIRRGSILDTGFCAGLGRFDIVYAWGVLHHTGDQWTALRNAASLVADGGLLYVALYAEEAHLDPPPAYWLEIKRRYNRAGPLRRAAMEAGYVWTHMLGRRPANLLKLPGMARGYRRSRGMDLHTDVRDWLGGWPMEFSSIPAVVRFAAEELGLALVGLASGEANAEYLFTPTAAPAPGYPPLPFRDPYPVMVRLEDPAALRGGPPVHIFGTAAGAAVLLRAFDEASIAVAGFVDPAEGPAEGAGEAMLHGRPVLPFGRFAAQAAPDAPVVLSNRFVFENGRRLVEAGFTRVFDAHALVRRLAAAR